MFVTNKNSTERELSWVILKQTMLIHALIFQTTLLAKHYYFLFAGKKNKAQWNL